MITEWKKDLLADSSLHAVFRASRRFPKSDFNKLIYVVCGIAMISIAIIWLTNKDVQSSRHGVETAAELAFDLSVQILGFLIGGFAIFATVTDNKLMIRLAQVPMPGSEFSVFKHVFFNFLSVFYIYIVTLGLAVIVRIGASVDVIDVEAVLAWHKGPIIVSSVNTVAFCILSTFIILAVVRLKSFIWNIYRGFLIFLIASDSMKEETDRCCCDKRQPSTSSAVPPDANR